MEEILGVGVAQLRFDLLGRLVLAAMLGGAVGLEREWSGKPAGFRTNLLICVGAALLTDLSIAVANAADPSAMADPGRIAAQIVSGIGFLGAGTIIQSRVGVTGLTTAATLWVVAAIGMAVGARAYVDAVGTTVLVVVALLVLGQLEERLSSRVDGTIRVKVADGDGLSDRVERLLETRLKIRLMEIERQDDGVVAVYRVVGHPRQWSDLVRRVAEVEGVKSVHRS